MLRNFVYLVLALFVTVGLFSALFGGLVVESHQKETGRLSSQERSEIRQKAKDELSILEYRVLYEDFTEEPHSSPLLQEKRKGTFVTADTKLPVFRSEALFDSGTGFLSFTSAIENNVKLRKERSFLENKIEVTSVDTGAHLGFVCENTSASEEVTYCVNGAALSFLPD